MITAVHCEGTNDKCKVKTIIIQDNGCLLFYHAVARSGSKQVAVKGLGSNSLNGVLLKRYPYDPNSESYHLDFGSKRTFLQVNIKICKLGFFSYQRKCRKCEFSKYVKICFTDFENKLSEDQCLRIFKNIENKHR